MESVSEKLELKNKRRRQRKNSKDRKQKSQRDSQLEELSKGQPITPPVTEERRKKPWTNDDDHAYCQSPLLVNASLNNRIASLESRSCQVVLKRLDKDEMLHYQTSSTVDKEITRKKVKDSSLENLDNFVRYKGSSTRGNFLDMDDHDSWSPLSFNFSDDSLDSDYMPYDLFANKKTRYEEDAEWMPTMETVTNAKRKKVSKKSSTNRGRKLTLFNSLMDNLLESSTASGGNQNPRANTKPQLPYLNEKSNMTQLPIKPVPKYTKPMAHCPVSYQTTKIENPSVKDNHAMFCFGSEEARKIPKSLPEITSPNKMLYEYVVHCDNSSTASTPGSGCMYCKYFVELDAVTILAVASLDENPEAYVEEGIEYAKQMYNKVKSVQVKGGELNWNLKIVEKKMEGLKYAKDLLLDFGSFASVSSYLMKS